LSAAGHLATVQCIEVWCEMTSEYYSRYLTASHRKKQLLWVNNDNI
jgi:DNA excision repair protein ERCC-3